MQGHRGVAGQQRVWNGKDRGFVDPALPGSLRGNRGSNGANGRRCPADPALTRAKRGSKSVENCGQNGLLPRCPVDRINQKARWHSLSRPAPPGFGLHSPAR